MLGTPVRRRLKRANVFAHPVQARPWATWCRVCQGLWFMRTRFQARTLAKTHARLHLDFALATVVYRVIYRQAE